MSKQKSTPATGSSHHKGSSGRSSGEHESRATTDHGEIRRWVEERDGTPACVRGTGGRDDAGLLRIDFPGHSGEGSLQEIGWDEFFEEFEEQGLALLYQETAKDGEHSNFNKLVSPDTTEAKAGHGKGKHGG